MIFYILFIYKNVQTFPTRRKPLFILYFLASPVFNEEPIYGKIYDIPTLWLTPSTTQVYGILISDDRKDDSEQQKAKLRYAKVQILPSIIQDTTPNTLRDFLINLFDAYSKIGA